MGGNATRSLCIIAAAAALHWSFHAPAAVVAAPAASGSNIVIADTRGNVFALDSGNGKLRWTTILENGVWSAPQLFDNRVIVSTGDREFVALDPPRYALAGAHLSDIVALSARTGSILWEYDLAGSGAPGAALAGTTLVHHDGSSEVVALDALNGAYLWRGFIASIASSSAAVEIDADRIATSGAFPNCVVVMRARDGSILHRVCFTQAALGFAQAKIVSNGSRIYGTYYLAQGLPAEHLYAIDADRGRVLWDVVADRGAAGAPLPQLTLHGQTIIAGSPFRNVVQAFDGQTGARVWETPLRGRSVGGAATRGGRVYIADSAGWVTMLDAATGAIAGNYHAAGDMQDSTPAAIGNLIVIGSDEGDVRAIPLADI